MKKSYNFPQYLSSSKREEFAIIFYDAVLIQVIIALILAINIIIKSSFIMLAAPISFIISFITFYLAKKIKFKEGVWFGLFAILSNCFLLFTVYDRNNDTSPFFYFPYFTILIIWLLRLKKNLEILYGFPKDLSFSQKETFSTIFHNTIFAQVITAFIVFITIIIKKVDFIILTVPISFIIGFTAFYLAKKIKFKEGVYFELFLSPLILFLYIVFEKTPVIVSLLHFIILIIWFFRLEKILKVLYGSPKDLSSSQKETFSTIFYIAAYFQAILAFILFITTIIEVNFIIITGLISSIIGFIALYLAKKINFKEGIYFGLSVLFLSTLILYICIAFHKNQIIISTASLFYFIILIIWFFRLEKTLKILYDFPKDLSSSQKEEFTTIFYNTAIPQVIAALILVIGAIIWTGLTILTGPINSIIGFIALYWAKKIKFKEGIGFGLFAILLPLSLPLLIFFLSIKLSELSIIILTISLFYFIILTIWFFRLEKILKK